MVAAPWPRPDSRTRPLASTTVRVRLIVPRGSEATRTSTETVAPPTGLPCGSRTSISSACSRASTTSISVARGDAAGRGRGPRLARQLACGGEHAHQLVGTGGGRLVVHQRDARLLERGG
jgi:hypothetical protein